MASVSASSHALTVPTTKRPANAFNTASSVSSMSKISTTTGATAPTPNVAECMFEFLLGEMLCWVEEECEPANVDRQRANMNFINSSVDNPGDGLSRLLLQPPLPSSSNNIVVAATSQVEEDRAILAAEMAAAKMERFGFGAGYRLCERLAQTKPLATPTSPSPSVASPSIPAGTLPPSGSGASADILAATQLEAVKFLCKEFWMEVFRKQIDKLQTNHRGVFVLKDHELRWLRRLPSDDERARVAAIKLLAFPCGLIRGALANLGIMAVVSCDFLADGKSMAACSFNIKIKT